MTNAIISWLVTITFYSVYFVKLLVLTDLKYPLGLEGTYIYREIKIILCQALKGNSLHHKPKETFSLKNRYTITAITKDPPHPGQRGMQMFK